MQAGFDPAGTRTSSPWAARTLGVVTTPWDIAGGLARNLAKLEGINQPLPLFRVTEENEI